MRIAGSAMRAAGVEEADLALVDLAADSNYGQVVTAVHDDEFRCRRLCRLGDKLGLQATDQAVPEIWATADVGFDVWGVVTHVIM